MPKYKKSPLIEVYQDNYNIIVWIENVGNKQFLLDDPNHMQKYNTFMQQRLRFPSRIYSI